MFTSSILTISGTTMKYGGQEERSKRAGLPELRLPHASMLFPIYHETKVDQDRLSFVPFSGNLIKNDLSFGGSLPSISSFPSTS